MPRPAARARRATLPTRRSVARRPSSRRALLPRSASRAPHRRARPRRAVAARRSGRARSRSPSPESALPRPRAPAGTQPGRRARGPPCAADGERRRSRAQPRARRQARPVPSGEESSMTSTRASSGRTPPSARSIGSRFSRSLYVGRQTIARTAVSSRAGWPPAHERRRRRTVRAPGRHLRARERGVVPRARLPTRSHADSRDRDFRRADGARWQGEGAPGSRQDDRGEDRPDRRGR